MNKKQIKKDHKKATEIATELANILDKHNKSMLIIRQHIDGDSDMSQGLIGYKKELVPMLTNAMARDENFMETIMEAVKFYFHLKSKGQLEAALN